MPRTLTGIVRKLWDTGTENRLVATLIEMSTPIGPVETPPPPSAPITTVLVVASDRVSAFDVVSIDFESGLPVIDVYQNAFDAV